MDIYEETAIALEDAQYIRFCKCKDRDTFFDTNNEGWIFQQIKDLRAKSSTYNKDIVK